MTCSRPRATPPSARAPGEDATEGFQFSLGHGVGLEVHEEPVLGLAGRRAAGRRRRAGGRARAVVAGVGGVRFEDLLLVTGDGCETLTSYPYTVALG